MIGRKMMLRSLLILCGLMALILIVPGGIDRSAQAGLLSRVVPVMGCKSDGCLACKKSCQARLRSCLECTGKGKQRYCQYSEKACASKYRTRQCIAKCKD